MSTLEYKNISNELKKLLKARKITYKELASKLELSEANIKKILNAEDVSFNRVVKILSLCGVSVEDFFSTLRESKPQTVKLNSEQEDFFINNPNYYNFFYQLLGANLDCTEVQTNHNLSQLSLDRYLLKLDKLNLIELHENNKIKSEFAGNVRLTFSNELAKVVVNSKHQALLDFAHIPNKEFRGKKHLVNGSLEMKPETAKEYVKAVKDLTSEFMKRSSRESVIESPESLDEIGFLFVVTPTQGINLETIPNID